MKTITLCTIIVNLSIFIHYLRIYNIRAHNNAFIFNSIQYNNHIVRMLLMLANFYNTQPIVRAI